MTKRYKNIAWRYFYSLPLPLTLSGFLVWMAVARLTYELVRAAPGAELFMNGVCSRVLAAAG
jgi:hypothetical protein